MTPILVIAGTLAALCLSTSVLRAADYRCDAPPYGLSYGGYKSFALNFSTIFPDPDPFLNKLCIGKFENQSSQRQALYGFGLSASFIDATPMDDLVVPVVMAMKRQAGGR